MVEVTLRKWIDRFIEFDTGFKILYISSVSFFTFLVDLVLSYFLFSWIPRELISYIFFLVFFFFWSFRIIIADLRSDNTSKVSHSDILKLGTVTFICLLLLSLWFAHAMITFLPMLYTLLGFSVVAWLMFKFAGAYIFERSDVHIYFAAVAIAAGANVLILFLYNYFLK